ncbi:Putidaredoxin reductase [Nocardioides dokdonensis FR1436]|uniref:Putidaredoxin reductase n=1 Tax=Nocardioides dokdonensis FR1436 TaxID=1300347 RepID=A0A1A9GLN0_9ACTN|nr:FAD-dependent oxidoreductase [Nocardioides dokdonensis]ANH38365.1 Putidaredoxin reductase [Nocardioides dokdonensis FR1436]
MDTTTPDPRDQRVVVVGGGLTGGAAVVALRERGHRGPLTLVCAEDHVPYERPGLSKGYLAGSEDAAALEVQPPGWYAEHHVDLRLATTVTGLDLAARTVTTSAGDRVRYDQLLLATGAAPRHLAMADDAASHGAPVCYLRTIEDADVLQRHLHPGRHVVLIGGGFIGLEVAATARGRGAEVTVVESQALPLVGVLGEQVALRLAEVHRDHGVDLRLGTQVTGVRVVDELVMVDLDGRPGVTGDVLVVGVGATPRTELAERAGLEVDGGIVVDEHLRTSDPHVLAAGDVARFAHPALGRSLRVEHWATAQAHGRLAARSALGEDALVEEQPFFFSDQYDLGLEHFGDVGPDGPDEVVVHGDLGTSLVAYYGVGGIVRAAMHVNDWDRAGEVKRAVTDGIGIETLRGARA